MHPAPQRTLQSPAKVQGTSLFTATPSLCTIQPAGINHGLVFSYGWRKVQVHPDAISNAPVHQAFKDIAPRCSALKNDHSTIWLVEHVLSALAGLGITNALIELSHHELPIMDGSSLPFVQAIHNAGIQTQDAQVQSIKLSKPIRVEQGDSWIEATPADSCSYQYTIDYGPDSPITKATVQWDGDPEFYAKNIAPARTFCLKHEADALLNAGLFQHLKSGEMLVLDNQGPIDNLLHNEHECAYHKLLDLIGDVALIGKPINAHIKAHKSGHALAHEFARAIINAQ